MALNLIMLGPPGAGKGTQAERFAGSRGIPKISTGDMLRDAVKAGTEIGQKVKTIMERGDLVSDDVMIGLVKERLDRPDARVGFILDGFPRTVAQAKALDRLMEGRDPLIVIDIVVPEAEIVRRLGFRMICEDCGHNAEYSPVDPDACGQCGGKLKQRADDNVEIVRERLKVYHRMTEPLVEYYKSRPTFRAVNGGQPQDVVASELVSAIEQAGSLGAAR